MEAHAIKQRSEDQLGTDGAHVRIGQCRNQVLDNVIARCMKGEQFGLPRIRLTYRAGCLKAQALDLIRISGGANRFDNAVLSSLLDDDLNTDGTAAILVLAHEHAEMIAMQHPKRKSGSP